MAEGPSRGFRTPQQDSLLSLSDTLGRAHGALTHEADGTEGQVYAEDQC